MAQPIDYDRTPVEAIPDVPEDYVNVVTPDDEDASIDPNQSPEPIDPGQEA